ncbi:MAG: hypothetical protein ACTHNM_08205 [Dyella sp.]|uniref:hypothetical protein n=1 Tax=Dyella sp. TaxID=1869338 RepID=UPI003F80016B
MKESTLHSLITARSLLDHSRSLIESSSAHAATAGLILLQDAVELVLLAAVNERDLDDAAKAEKLTFDQIVGNLIGAGLRVPKSGTLKAMNRHRVLAKHYGQLVLPETARGYLEASQTSIDAVLQDAVGTDLRSIVLTDLLDNGEAKDFLVAASELIGDGNYLKSLVAVRQALFIEVESNYSVEGHINGHNIFGGGWRAPAFAKNAEWIKENVKEPTDYVVIDNDKLRTDALEWGFNVNELSNIRRLTPAVFRSSPNEQWFVAYDLGFPEHHATLQNAQYCLDRTIELVRRKQLHEKALAPWVALEAFQPPPVFIGEPLFNSASNKGEVVHVVTEGYRYRVSRRCTGFDGATEFLRVTAFPEGSSEWMPGTIWGFLEDRPDRPTPFAPESNPDGGGLNDTPID